MAATNPADPAEAARALSTCVALLSRAAGRTLMPWNMTWPQAMSLLLLRAEDQPVNATRLVERLGLGRTAMTAVVDRLERRGWVERRPHARDRRVALLELTDDGRRIAEDARDALDRSFAEFMREAELPPSFDAVTRRLTGGLP